MVGMFRAGVFLGYCTLFAQVQARAPTPNLIHVEIAGLRSDQGKVQCDLFSAPAGFPKDPSKASAHFTSEGFHRRAFCDFVGVAAGTYAVSVYHDENSNGKMDTNFVGMPREGVGASNNAKGHFGPPKFRAAAFSYTGGHLDLKVGILYLSGGAG